MNNRRKREGGIKTRIAMSSPSQHRDDRSFLRQKASPVGVLVAVKVVNLAEVFLGRTSRNDWFQSPDKKKKKRYSQNDGGWAFVDEKKTQSLVLLPIGEGR